MIAGSEIPRRGAMALVVAGVARILRSREAETSAPSSLPLRIAISETMVTDVNLSDARAAMQTWIKRMQVDLDVTIQIDPKIFSTSEEVVRGIRTGQLDAAALNLVEYRPIADLFDSRDLLVGGGASGPDEYVVLTRKNSPFKRLPDLRGCRLSVLKAPKMCVAPGWLATLLDDERLGPAETFFSSILSETKVSRVVLPVFFAQVDGCLTSKRGFQIMCELNPQVARSLAVIANSPLLVTCFYAFRKKYPRNARARFLEVHNSLLSSPTGRQLATLFQFDEMNVGDAECLAPGLAILDRAERARGNNAPGRKGPFL